MINKMCRRAVVMGLFLTIFILGTYQGYAATKILQPKIYQHLDIGVVFGHQGKDWSEEEYLVGGSYSVSKSINLGKEIELVGAYPLVGNEGKFDFNDGDACTHNILPQYSFPVHYAPYSAALSNISASSSGSRIHWSFNARLTAPRKMGVVAIVNKYKGMPGGVEKAREEIYGPLGGEDVVRTLYYKSYENIEQTIEKALNNNLGDNDVILYFCPIVFQYKKYVEVEDILAALEAPSTVKKGGSYTVSDASEVDKNLLVSEGVLEKEINGKWKEIARWQGSGRFGENTGGQISEKADKEGRELYRYTIKTTTGQQGTCTKTVIIADQRQMDGKVELMAPKYSYEGHEFDVYDLSEFTIDGKYIHPQKAYDEGLARNNYHSAADRVRRIEKDAKMTFLRKGNYSITLEVRLKGGKSLYDSKKIEILKTPFAYVGVGGIQKQNRKQNFNIKIATSPEYPIVEYELHIKDTVTNEIAKISDKTPYYVGKGIKTRTALLNKENDRFSSLSVEFLTKYPSYFETGKEERRFEYYFKVKDAKDDEDIQRGEILVRPDLPPDVNVYMKDLFLREEGSNFAKIIAEDISTSDGDLFVRNWEYIRQDDSGDEDGDFENILDLDGYADLSLGNKQKISWKKEGVGRFKVKLSVREEWQEETLPEFVNEEDYLFGEGFGVSEVSNIAPRVSVSPLESQGIDLVLIGNEAELAEAKKQENNIQSHFIENGIDANISYVRFRKQKDGMEPYGRFVEEHYNAGVNNSLSDSIYMLGDEDCFYTLKGNTYYDSYSSERGRPPYEIEARDSRTGQIKWRFAVNEENCRAYVSESGKYFCIASQNTLTTKLLDRKTGQYIGAIPICVNGKIFTDKSDERIYIVGQKEISAYNIGGNSLKKVIVGDIYLPHVHKGKLTFIVRKAQVKFSYVTLDLETEELLEVEYPDLGNALNYRIVGENVEYVPINPYFVDTKGNAIFASNYMVRSYEYLFYGAWFVDLQSGLINRILERRISDEERLMEAGGVYDEKGEIVDFYYNYYEYDSATNRRRGRSGMGVVRNGDVNFIFTKNRIKRIEDVEMLLAKKDTEKNLIHLIKAGRCNEDILMGKVARTLDLNTMAVQSDSNFGRYVPGGAENYVEQDDYAIFGIWFDYYTVDSKSIRTSALPLNNKQLLWKIFNKKVNLRNGVSRYVLALNDHVKELLSEGNEAKKDIKILRTSDWDNAHEEILDGQNSEVGMLLLKGGEREEAKAKTLSNLKINNIYNYEYTLYKKGDAAEDVLTIVNLDRNYKENTYKKVVEKQQFTVAYVEGFIKTDGGMLGGYRGSSYKGLGNVAGKKEKSASFKIEFEMEKDGYMEFDIAGVFGSKRRSQMRIVDNNFIIDDKSQLDDGIRHRYFPLSKGKHVISFEAYSEYRYTCEISLKNIEIGYFETKNPMNLNSEVSKVGEGKFLVRGQFNAISEQVALEFNSKGDEGIKVSNFRMYGEEESKNRIKREVCNQEFSNKEYCKDWNFIAGKGATAEIVKSKRQIGEMEGELVYKKGQLVRYKVNYKDYEEDPSKKEYWLYLHTPYNDGKHPKAFAIRNLDGSIREIMGEENRQVEGKELIELAEKTNAYIYDKPIDKFYIDGKYTVYHWQEDNTTRGVNPLGNPRYDKKSNICEITFYVEGTSNAPWVKEISTNPEEVEVGKNFSINVEIDDLEKETLSLITEVYKKGKCIFVHKSYNIQPNEEGKYPVINTGIVTQKAQRGVYKVVCTVSDENSVGVGKYQFLVKENKDIKGKVSHTAEWENNRQKYNENVCKTSLNKWIKLSDYIWQKKPRPRGTNVFWAGESFVLEADVIGNAQEVRCHIRGTPYGTNLKVISSTAEKSVFSGKLWKNDMKKEWAGKEALPLTFVFTAVYDDGESKEFIEEVIIDDSEDFRKLHRKW